ncbi:MAG: hypothetical protein AT718_11280 [Vulcanisaeta sp. JCHS_4]|jgi:hypothetical protein|nr:MAG: hypothetical protein AT718_11280 [Vulcanisaeta sp. JCHS_4]
MTAIHILLQAGNVTISSAVNQFVNEVGVPAFDAVLFIGGLSFIIAIVMAILHFVEYLWHPTSFGRTSALTEAIFHAKKTNLWGAGHIPSHIHNATGHWPSQWERNPNTKRRYIRPRGA